MSDGRTVNIKKALIGMLIITIEVIALILVNRVVEALSDKSYKDELTDLSLYSRLW